MHPAARQWRTSLERIDGWFEGRRRDTGDVVPCRAGCTACCHGPFDISIADALLLREAIAELPPADQLDIRDRGRRLLARMTALTPQWHAPWDIADLGEPGFDLLVESLAEVPCPLLGDDGRCRVYQARPLVCRMRGLPMMTAEGLVLENACPIQEQFPGYAALDPALFDFESLEAAEQASLDAAAVAWFDSPLHAGFETTIAAVAAG